MELLSIVLPCYNPPPHWQEHIIGFMAKLNTIDSHIELIIVNDGCTHSIDQDISKLKNAIPHFNWISYPENRGKGFAIRQGVAAAKGDFIIYTDIDFPYTFDSFMKVYEALKNNVCAVAVGIKNEAYYTKVPFFRKVISRLFKQMIRTVIGLKITDTQCGLKGINKEAKDLLLSGSIDRYLFDLEFIYRAEKQGLRLQAIPIALRDGVVFSTVKSKILIAELKNFLTIIRR